MQDMATGELIDYNPATPIELEMLIRTLADRIVQSVPAIERMWRDRYDRERELIEAKARVQLFSDYELLTDRRADATLSTIEHLQRFNDAKVALHAAEELQKALQAKLFGYQNINKSVTAAYNGGGNQ